jgi:hypothetical protein
LLGLIVMLAYSILQDQRGGAVEGEIKAEKAGQGIKIGIDCQGDCYAPESTLDHNVLIANPRNRSAPGVAALIRGS